MALHIWRLPLPSTTHLDRGRVLVLLPFGEARPPPPRAMSSAVCFVCGAPTLEVCSGCKVVRLCSTTCLQALWRTHKHVCRAKGAALQQAVHDRSQGALCVVWTPDRGRGLALTRDLPMGTAVVTSPGFAMSEAIVNLITTNDAMRSSDCLGADFWRRLDGTMAREFALSDLLDRGPADECPFVFHALPMQCMVKSSCVSIFRVFSLPLALCNHACRPNAVVTLRADPDSAPALVRAKSPQLAIDVEGSPQFQAAARDALLSRDRHGGKVLVTLTLATGLRRGREVTLCYATAPTRQECQQELATWGPRMVCTSAADRGAALMDIRIAAGFDPPAAIALLSAPRACQGADAGGSHSYGAGHVPTEPEQRTLRGLVCALAVAPLTCATKVNTLRDRVHYQALMLRLLAPFRYLLASDTVVHSVLQERERREKLLHAGRDVYGC